jgi:hypothetical protein
MATPAETTPPPAGEPGAAAPALEPAAPAGGAPDPQVAPALDPQGLPVVLPDGVQMAGRAGGQPPTPVVNPPAPAVTPPAVPAPAAPPAAPAAPGTTADPGARPEITSLPDWAQSLIKDTRAEAARSRVEGKQAAADEARTQLAQDIGKALGIITDETPAEQQLTPEQLQSLLAGERTSTKMARTELAVFKAATGGAFNAAALLDSRSFLDAVKDLDPSDTEAVNAAIASAVQANPWLVNTPAATPAAPAAPGQPAPVVPSLPAPPSGGSFAGGPGGQPQDISTLSIDDFRKMRRDTPRS